MFFVLLTILTALIPLHMEAKESSPEMAQTYIWMEKGEWLPFKAEVPSDFVLKPILLNGEFSLNEGILWGTQESIENIWSQLKNNPEDSFKTSSGVIRARMSPNVTQTQSGKFSLKESELKAQFKQLGAKEVNFKHLKWGEYPLFIATATFSDRKPIAIVWMGLNQGPVIIIDYIFPEDQTNYDKDWAIWNRFIDKTTAVPLEVLLNRANTYINSLKNQSKQQPNSELN